MLVFQIKALTIIAVFFLLFSQRQNTRTLLIFTDKVNNANTVQQVNILNSNPGGVRERDIVFKVIPYSNNANAGQYKAWHVPNSPFTVLLIGKDGGEKLRSHQPVTLEKLFDLIDNMPMRQQEIKYKH